MLALPRLVGDGDEVELARRDRDLLHASVELVAVGVEVVDGQARPLALVGAEPVDHRLGLQQPHVLQRADVVGERARRLMSAKLDLPCARRCRCRARAAWRRCCARCTGPLCRSGWG